jgi:hypothetical protein
MSAANITPMIFRGMPTRCDERSMSLIILAPSLIRLHCQRPQKITDGLDPAGSGRLAPAYGGCAPSV